jgi:magnesium chelatase accessory protein
MNAPRWDIDGRDWPNREASHFVTVSGLSWHVQLMGEGPTLLLLHGSGAATHSWRGLAPLLAPHFSLIAPDLPGHGFTGMAPGYRLSLPDVSRAVARLLDHLGAKPAIVIGHSAGAAIMLRMTLDGLIAPDQLFAINGALRPFPGAAGSIFPALAKLLFLNPFVPGFIANRARDPRAIGNLLKSTGSHLDHAGVELYARLLRTPAHVEGTLGLMANWNLAPLVDDLVRLRTPLTLIVGASDHTVPPAVADETRARARHAEIITLPGLGHLAHEERPDLIADIVLAARAATAAA